MNIYEKIRQLRIEYGMSQDDLAKAMGYKDRSMITKIESGKVDISQKKIIAFARALNTTEAYLMGWTENKYTTRDELEQDFNEYYEENGHPVARVPRTDEARILAKGIDKLPPADRAQALAVVRAMFAKHPEIFDD